MPTKMRYVRSRTQKIKLKGKRTTVIPKRDWKGPGLYYHRNGRWVKYSKSLDMKRGHKLGKGPYRYRHD